MISRVSDKKRLDFLSSQTKLAASICVSLGLIGTFLGLTDMIGSIAGSLSGDGNMAEKMSAMMTSIASALNAMSFAFLTSIVGVTTSVLLLLSLNYWSFYYSAEEKNSCEFSAKELNKEELLDKLSAVENVNLTILQKLISANDSNDNLVRLITTNKDIICGVNEINKSLLQIHECQIEMKRYSDILEKILDAMHRKEEQNSVLIRYLDEYMQKRDRQHSNLKKAVEVFVNDN